MLISFVIPCYRSEYTIESVINEIVDTMAQRVETDYEIITVNDGSPDGVYQVLRKIAATNCHVKIINFSKNFGKASAVLAGCKRCSGDIVVFLDDDGQCPAYRVWELIEPLETDDVDMTVASYYEKKESLIKKVGSAVNSFLIAHLIDQPEGLMMENFSAQKKYIIDEIVKYQNPYPVLHPLLVQATHSIVMVPMEERERNDGKSSGFTLIKSIRHMINGFTNFSVKPLRMTTCIGFAFSAIGAVYGLFVIIKRLLNPLVAEGYTTIVALLLLIGGLILLALGIIGEYIGRMYICINNKPQYVIKNEINIKE